METMEEENFRKKDQEEFKNLIDSNIVKIKTYYN